MNHEEQFEADNVAVFVNHLEEMGFSEDEAKDNARQLSEIILLTTIMRLCEDRGIDMAQVNGLSPDEKKDFIAQNFPTDEFTQMLFAVSEEKIGEYLQKITQKSS